LVPAPRGHPQMASLFILGRTRSLFSIPGDVKHAAACKADAEYIIYKDWQCGFDMKPATPKIGGCP
jgi:hypothetical protein